MNITLQDTDKHVLNVKNGDLPLLFTGPHNGHDVPSCLHQSLGACPDWFKQAHEATDLHMADLFTTLYDTIGGANFLSSNYSRLVCDLNAMPDYAITRCSPEENNLIIPHNQTTHCCPKQMSQRLQHFYWPYHDMLKKMITNIRQHHGGAIVLDLHSFSPTWKGQKRDVEIGTIRTEKTPLSIALESYLRTQNDYNFISGEPYRVADRPSNAAPIITETNDLQYVGIEMRHDLIADTDGRAKIGDFLGNVIDNLLNHPERDTLMKPRNTAMPDTPTPLTKQREKENNTGWMI